MILVLLLPAPAAAAWCWDPVPEADAYRLYETEAGLPGVAWHCLATVAAVAVCLPDLPCCTEFPEAHGPIPAGTVRFYIVTALDSTGQRPESDGGHGPKDPCP